MSKPVEWVPVSTLCELSGQTDRSWRKVLSASSGGVVSWRQCQLAVRMVKGKGGRSGISYEVEADSLPIALQARLKALQAEPESPLKHGPEYQTMRQLWYAILQPIAALPARSTARAIAIDEASRRDWVLPNGHSSIFSARTIRRKLKLLEDGRSAQITRKQRRDAGRKKVYLTRCIDNAAKSLGVPNVTIANHGAMLIRTIQFLISRNEPRAQIRHKATALLGGIVAELGIDPATVSIAIPEHLIQQQSDHRKVARYRFDRKAHEDAKPRITRTIAGLPPMHIVVGDVHPVDIQYRRDDGSLATPRLIGWHCFTTKRFIGTLVFCEKGEDVTNAHVIQSLLEMFDAWGVPEHLYLDNGSEYHCADMLEPGLRLLRDLRPASAPLVERKSAIVRANAYNAAGKPGIEGLFSNLERNYLSSIPGWIAGDRMRKKSANVGKPPAPYPGSQDQLAKEIQQRIALYNATAQRRGELKGRSPDQTFAEAVANGWHMTAVDPMAFQIAFSTEEVRTVRQGRISWKGRQWTCPELHSFLGDKVAVLVPKYEHWDRLPVKRIGESEPFAYASPERAYLPLDPEGAAEAARRSKRYANAVRELSQPASALPAIHDNIIQLPAVVRAPIGATLGASDQARRIISNVTEPEHERQQREADDDAAMRSKRLAKLEARMRKSGK